MPRLRRGLSHLFPKHLPGAWRGYPVSKARERNALKRDEFVQRVQDIGELSSREEAERAIKAALETLKQRLAGYDPDNLAAQLPEDLADSLRGEGGREGFGLAEFYRRFAQKEGVKESQAIRYAQAVALVLQEAVTTGEMDDCPPPAQGRVRRALWSPGRVSLIETLRRSCAKPPVFSSGSLSV